MVLSGAKKQIEISDAKWGAKAEKHAKIAVNGPRRRIRRMGKNAGGQLPNLAVRV
jgi:hypothetical protein